MSDYPEKIWVWQHHDENERPMGFGEWYTEEVILDGDEAEYIRVDLHLARIRELEAEVAGLKLEAGVARSKQEEQTDDG